MMLPSAEMIEGGAGTAYVLYSLECPSLPECSLSRLEEASLAKLRQYSKECKRMTCRVVI